ncbi:MAG TPA: methyltransferase domain-containing protein [Candidatus Dormibacteraeota bacterium]|jgi:SAM-dependent methyltransferase|nr:methyltransferase domain-containing protein [Candidatus Dormibacteraeota bacterium]
MKSKELFPQVFGRHALAYQERIEQVMARGEARGRLRVLELVDAQPGMRVLDLACGPGNLSRRLAEQVSPGGEVVGVDLAPGMIEVARAAGIPNARFEVMDIERLTFPGGYFDAAVCGHGLQFAPDLALALREARRVLRGGARFAASVPVEGNNESVWALLETVIDRRLPPAPQATDQRPTRAAIADREQFGRAALDAGFASAEVEVIEEHVRWESAEQLVSMFTSWWSCASRLDGIDDTGRRQFTKEAIETIKRAHPGAIDTTGRNHVLFAVA